MDLVVLPHVRSGSPSRIPRLLDFGVLLFSWGNLKEFGHLPLTRSSRLLRDFRWSTIPLCRYPFSCLSALDPIPALRRLFFSTNPQCGMVQVILHCVERAVVLLSHRIAWLRGTWDLPQPLQRRLG